MLEHNIPFRSLLSVLSAAMIATSPAGAQSKIDSFENIIGPPMENRSEERRVGKECRSRWSPDHSKKKTEIRIENESVRADER